MCTTFSGILEWFHLWSQQVMEEEEFATIGKMWEYTEGIPACSYQNDEFWHLPHKIVMAVPGQVFVRDNCWLTKVDKATAIKSSMNGLHYEPNMGRLLVDAKMIPIIGM